MKLNIKIVLIFLKYMELLLFEKLKLSLIKMVKLSKRFRCNQYVFRLKVLRRNPPGRRVIFI